MACNNLDMVEWRTPNGWVFVNVCQNCGRAETSVIERSSAMSRLRAAHGIAEYRERPEADDTIMTVEDFRESVASGAFIDYDGYGHPMRDGRLDRMIEVLPSRVRDIPKDATHIVWYNR